jgi:MFS family permease
MFSSLKVKNFRIYWLGMVVSLTGTWIQSVAQSWLVFQLTNSAILLGVVGFLGAIPIFLLSLLGGVLADRMNKRIILIFTQTSFMLLAFLLAVLTQLKLVRASQIMVIAVLNGVVMAFDAPSRQAVTVELVGKDNLMNAIALNSIAFNSTRIIGPALAGVLVAAIGMSGCFYLNGISFLAVIFALFWIKINKHTLNNKSNTALKDLKDGIVFVKNNRLILVLITMVGIVSLFGMSYIILMPIFANDILKVGVKGMGLLMSSSGVGALIGGLLLARLGDFKYKGRLLILASIVFSLSVMLFGLSKSFFLSLFALIFVGGTSVTALALINTLLQTKVPDDFRGRVMGVFMLTFAGILPFGNLIAGGIAEALGVSFAVSISGAFCAIFFIIVNTVYPDLKKI